MQRASCLLLAITLVACPLFCSAGLCGGTAHNDSVSREVQRCCPCCPVHDSPADRSNQDRSNSGEQPSSDGCQCICGGAVSGEGATMAAARLLSDAMGVPAVVDFTLVFALDFRRLSARFPDVGWHPSGRELCSLHMTFLC